MDKRLEKIFDENLRDVPCDPVGLKEYVDELEQNLKTTSENIERVRILGQIGVHLRSLGELDLAEEKIQRALEIIKNHELGIKWEIQQKIRLAHVLQWKRLFEQSNMLFDEILSVCRTNTEAGVYLDFALQHAGKNIFDQARYQEALLYFEEALQLRIHRCAPADQLASTEQAIERIKNTLKA